MYRRESIINAGGFNESLGACEDYELYLKNCAPAAGCVSSRIAADYRQHGTNMSQDAAFMLSWALKVHDAELPFVRGIPERETAFREGDHYLREYYGDQIFVDAYHSLSVNPRNSIKRLRWLAKKYPAFAVLRRRIRELLLSFLKHRAWPKRLRERLDPPLGEIRLGSFRVTHPIYPSVDEEKSILRAQAIQLLRKQDKYIRGDVLQIGFGGASLDHIEDLDDEGYDTVVLRHGTTSGIPSAAIHQATQTCPEASGRRARDLAQECDRRVHN